MTYAIEVQDWALLERYGLDLAPLSRPIEVLVHEGDNADEEFYHPDCIAHNFHSNTVCTQPLYRVVEDMYSCCARGIKLTLKEELFLDDASSMTYYLRRFERNLEVNQKFIEECEDFTHSLSKQLHYRALAEKMKERLEKERIQLNRWLESSDHIEFLAMASTLKSLKSEFSLAERSLLEEAETNLWLTRSVTEMHASLRRASLQRSTLTEVYKEFNSRLNRPYYVLTRYNRFSNRVIDDVFDKYGKGRSFLLPGALLEYAKPGFVRIESLGPISETAVTLVSDGMEPADALAAARAL